MNLRHELFARASQVARRHGVRWTLAALAAAVPLASAAQTSAVAAYIPRMRRLRRAVGDMRRNLHHTEPNSCRPRFTAFAVGRRSILPRSGITG